MTKPRPLAQPRRIFGSSRGDGCGNFAQPIFFCAVARHSAVRSLDTRTSSYIIALIGLRQDRRDHLGGAIGAAGRNALHPIQSSGWPCRQAARNGAWREIVAGTTSGLGRPNACRSLSRPSIAPNRRSATSVTIEAWGDVGTSDPVNTTGLTPNAPCDERLAQAYVAPKRRTSAPGARRPQRVSGAGN